ncbi:hypothetical protein WN944_022116 [Citrus x changshan-huyou]|uniref:Prephenate/arogenate dehydrogenase domain-containing protein n=1 Tax=Citrus x changshan-huyou TaxID=2935761 RepID=A0AAP0N451_9ROSI
MNEELPITRSKDVLQPHEYIPQASGSVDASSKLKIAIVGFGNFGQFIAKTIVRQGHKKVLKSLPFQRLKRSTMFVDVLSVKEFPRKLFFQHLPPDFDILCTHPMFGRVQNL